MLTRLIDACLRYRPLVLLATAVLALVGFSSLARLPFDAFPDTTPVQVQVNTTAPALSPLEVERQITFPVEQAISGLPGLTEGPVDFEVRLLAGDGDLRRRHGRLPG